MTAPVPAPDRDRETREAEVREEIARTLHKAGRHWACGWPGCPVAPTFYRFADAVLALPALRAVRDDALRRDLAALAEEWEREGGWSLPYSNSLRRLLDREGE